MITHLPDSFQCWLENSDYPSLKSFDGVGGGCISQTGRLTFSEGRAFFLKFNENAPAEMFLAEAHGLSILEEAKQIRVPNVIYAADEFIVLEEVSSAPRQHDYWEQFGAQLAALHSCHGPSYGFERDNYCGSSPQSNLRSEDGYEFFAEQRLLFQARMAVDNRALDIGAANQIERLCTKLQKLVPYQPASLIHGDLWSGNAHVGPEGEPVLIDPAAYWGWAEAELGMTKLFGGFPNSFYQSYINCNPLEKGWESRLDLYNIYHLLNHLNLFGGGYLGQVMAAVKKYL